MWCYTYGSVIGKQNWVILHFKIPSAISYNSSRKKCKKKNWTLKINKNRLLNWIDKIKSKELTMSLLIYKMLN